MTTTEYYTYTVTDNVSDYTIKANHRDCLITQDIGYTVFSTVGAFYIPLLFMLIVYLNIFRTARFRIRKRQFKQPARRMADNGGHSCSDVETDVSGGGGGGGGGGVHLNFPTSDGQSGLSACSFGTDGGDPNLNVIIPFGVSSPASARYLSAANIICASGQ